MIEIIVLCFIIVLVILSFMYNDNTNDKNEFLCGVWEGSDEFCKDSMVKDFTLIINDDCSTCYLIINSDTGIIETSKCHMTIESKTKEGKDTVFEIEIEGSKNIPKKPLKMKLNISDGLITIYNDSDNYVYAELIKNNELSCISKKIIRNIYGS